MSDLPLKLRWMPLDFTQWDDLTGGLLPEQEGALLRLIRAAWTNATAPCTVPDDDQQLAVLSKLGGRWTKLGRAVRAQFTPCAEHPGRLRCEWLYTTYLQQIERYATNVARGKKGGRPRKVRVKLEKTPTLVGVKSEETEQELEGELISLVPSGPERDKHPLGASAVACGAALTGAAAPAPPPDDERAAVPRAGPGLDLLADMSRAIRDRRQPERVGVLLARIDAGGLRPLAEAVS